MAAWISWTALLLSRLQLSKSIRADSTAWSPSRVACRALPTVTCTMGCNSSQALEGHSRTSGAFASCWLAADACFGSWGAPSSASARLFAASAAASACEGASPWPPSAPPATTSSTTSWACRCSVGGRGLQVLRSREGVVGRARAILHRHASGETRFQDSSRCRAKRSRHCTRDWSTLNCRDSSGRCLELKRSHSFMAALGAFRGLSAYCCRHRAVLLSRTDCRATTPSAVACRSASGVSRVPMPCAGTWANSAFFRQS
mmetsp:Transcript_104573/g.312333  ORF Transcript_104573/g.312333 Transcript_104573/m.312333 type:complete len:259 (+) Transcript_104573:514-1290(+)